MTKRLILTGVVVLANLAILYVLLFLSSNSSFEEWAPGVLFGLAFAAINMKSRSEVISFTLLSGIAYWLAVKVAVWSTSYDVGSSSTSTPLLEETIDVITPFGVAGVIGAAILMASLKLLTTKRLSGYDVLIVVVGGLAGFAFGKVIPDNDILLGYLIWQLPVGLALAVSLPVASEAGEQASHSALQERISKFLQTPIFVIIGLIVNLIALYQFLQGLVPK